MWIDGYEHRPTENCGGFTTPQSKPKKLWHTTESGFGSIDAVHRLFRDATLNSPHFLVDPGTWRMMQFAPLGVAACALRGGGSRATNGAYVIQTEICGYAADSHRWNDNVLMFLAQHAVNCRKAAQRAWGRTFEHTVSVKFYGLDAGFTLAVENAPQRMSYPVWLAENGHVGHQHAPYNDHWDPGKLNVARICEFANLIEAGGTVLPEITPDEWEEWFSMKTDAEIQAMMEQAATSALIKTVPANLLNGTWEQQSRGFLGEATVQIKGQSAQYLVCFDRGGEYKVHVDDPEVHGLMVELGIIRRNMGLLVLDPATRPGAVAWVNALPTHDPSAIINKLPGATPAPA